MRTRWQGRRRTGSLPRYIVAVALGIVSLVGGAARAGPPARAVLDYHVGDGIEGCPSTEGLREAIVVRLGYDPVEPRASTRVEIRITKRRGRLHGEVLLKQVDPSGVEGARDETLGRRVVRGQARACSELASVLALAVSLALDPAAAQRPHRPRRGRDGIRRHGKRRTVMITVPKRSPAPGGRDPGWRWQTSLSAVGSTGLAPDGSLGFAHAWGLGRGPWSMDVELRADLPASSVRMGTTLVTRVASLGFVPCLSGPWVRGCLVAAAGGRWARGEGLSGGDEGPTPWAALGARVAARAALGGEISGLVHLDLMVPVTMSTLHVAETPVWRSPPAALSLGIGVGWQLH